MLTRLIDEGLAREATAETLAAALEGQSPDLSADEIAELAVVVERFVRGLPGVIDALGTMARAPRTGRSAAFAVGQVLAFLMDGEDLLPESEFGPLGLLDDAYLAHALVGTLRTMAAGTTIPEDYEAPAPADLAVIRELLPAGVADALARTAESLVLIATSLFGAAGDRTSLPAGAPALRVAEAIGTVRRT
jgi:uncharacterized membrane protein YkvA (DUF1232 family)